MMGPTKRNGVKGCGILARYKMLRGAQHDIQDRNTITTKTCELFRSLMILFLLVGLSAKAAEPQQPGTQGSSEEDLVKQTQNPVADLISVPFQNNYNFAAGPKHNHMVYLLNIQPVIPINITENWNLIARIITPVINLPSLAPGIGSATGLGDINPTFFLSPARLAS